MDSSSVIWWSGAELAEPLARLPLATLYLTERCNSRCVSCDYWRHGRRDMDLETVERLLPDLVDLGTEVILISGGEPLLHPHWAAIATHLRARGLRLWLLTAGLALARHAAEVARHFEQVTVSLDGSTAASYAAIRGLDAFEVVCAGIRGALREGLTVGLRVTVQRGNAGELSDLVRLARELGVASISFLAADVGHVEAFGRHGAPVDGVQLRPDDLPMLARSLAVLEHEHGDDFASGFIAETPAKLRRILSHYRALLGLGEPPPVHCNAPEFSAVVEANGAVRPCFFIAGVGGLGESGLAAALNSPAQRRLRSDIRAGRRPECLHCVCSKWFVA
ncbi:radical SAM protein [Roseateles saccharophilus]|uniref:MoaA/NifB/PqqE/SkfB family radical SAM enzyme n=1 Tax=Roseateles saccharophilus TaxID=304 RepID=A0A4R3U9E6_ROSSA|nr:radical SAM protein [Roseateles saccharophilus]MDG0836200.1 radical SAM protein [Roseateles saccharophilus]TCU82728.1 MoaA/NifB/PqqE/SkfB family radical SAM enzyme [Roseateles saccharophilus]